MTCIKFTMVLEFNSAFGKWYFVGAFTQVFESLHRNEIPVIAYIANRGRHSILLDNSES